MNKTSTLNAISDGMVYTTHDYFMFKSIDGNRTKNLAHINRLKESMSKNYLFTVIIVNEKYEIIDGQHRFDAIVDLKLPLHYVICDGYSLNEVHILNQISKTWSSDDYLNGYCDLGYSHYIDFKKFKTTYKIGIYETMVLLAVSGNGETYASFKAGKFRVKNYAKACKTIETIFKVSPYYDGYKRRSFIHAMIVLLKKPQFEMKEFIKKLAQQPTMLVDCPTTTSYIELIEVIYNYRRREKVNLRF